MPTKTEWKKATQKDFDLSCITLCLTNKVQVKKHDLTDKTCHAPLQNEQLEADDMTCFYKKKDFSSATTATSSCSPNAALDSAHSASCISICRSQQRVPHTVLHPNSPLVAPHVERANLVASSLHQTNRMNYTHDFMQGKLREKHERWHKCIVVDSYSIHRFNPLNNLCSDMFLCRLNNNHCVTVWKNWIFDSNAPCTLPLEEKCLS